MSGNKYDGGETPAVGDFLRFDRDDDYWSVTRVTPDYVFATGEGGEKEQAIHAPAFKLIRRASGTSPRAGDGAEDGRFAVGAAWQWEISGPEWFDHVLQDDHAAMAIPRDGTAAVATRWTRESKERDYRYIGNLSDLVAGLQAAHRGTAPPLAERLRANEAERLAATEPPLTFPTCPACGERMPGAECQQPACAQVRKWAAVRKREDAARAHFDGLENVVRLAAEQWPGVKVVTDRVGPKGAHGACLFVELSAKGATESFLLGEGTGTSAAASMFRTRAEMIRNAVGDRALRVVGGGR